ncbi:MAG: VPLPA-CTERM sorting domain-containing protein [Gammaproteobacteria bacterium]
MNKKAIWAGALVSALCFTPLANAVTVTQCGPSICYEYDNAQVAAATYGQPTLIGDALRFIPTNFRAQSDDGAGIVNTSASFYFDRVYTQNPNDNVKKIMIYEFGDYEITTDGNVSDTLTLDASNNLGAGSASDTEIFSAIGDSAGLQQWDIDNTLNVDGSFITSDMNLTVTNVLEANTDAFGESAWIQKKLEIQVVSAIPLPAAAWFMLSGLGVLAGIAKRRQAAQTA